MTDSSFLIISSAVLLGLIWLIVSIFKKVARGEIGISVNAALLMTLAAILLIPFAMNFSAHLISGMMHSPGATVTSDSESGHH
ncbi:hypothetical protein SAMN05216386_0985 [Nitrosospira briensis]|uniref:Uncharacterized protein n=1 Tax=Nitrosospira briensis TaxID=35799 RepID=A0A1I4Z1V2_9PROT|nr:hypothetical protein [Nitrosospira briensis]SFN44222.1 hypothetical protein SAMN05216386_0985 [Nitrosospira briensis]